MAYDPHVFDLIREKLFAAEKKKKWKRFSAKIGAISFGIVLGLFALSIFSNADALETLDPAQYTRQKTGWDTVALDWNSGVGNWPHAGPGAYYGFLGRWDVSEGLALYGYTEGAYYYNNPIKIVLGVKNPAANYESEYMQSVAWSVWWNNGEQGWNGRDCGGDNCSVGAEFERNMQVLKTEINSEWVDLEILVNTDGIKHRFRVIAKKDGTQAFRASFSDYFVERNGFFYWVSESGLDFVFKRMNAGGTWDDIGTLLKPAAYSAPALPPRCVNTSAYTGTDEPVCFYKGQDGNPYAVFLFGQASALWRIDTGELTGGGWTNYICHWLPGCESGSQQPAIESVAGMRPIAVIEPAQDNIIVVYDRFPNPPQYMAVSGHALTVSGLFESEIFGFLGVSGFVNPQIYFARNNGEFGKWDLGCVQPGFEICGAYNSGFACQTANGSVPISPMPVLSCATPLEIPPYYYDSGGTGTGGTGTGGTGGGNCSGSGCISTGTGSAAVSGLKDFLDYVLNCDSDKSGDVSIAEGVSCIPGAIGRFFGGAFDRISEGFSKTWTLLEELMKAGTKSGSGSQLFSFSFYDTAEAGNAFSGEINPIIIASKQGIDALAESDNILDRMITFLKWALLTILTVSAIALFFSFRR